MILDQQAPGAAPGVIPCPDYVFAAPPLAAVREVVVLGASSVSSAAVTGQADGE